MISKGWKIKPNAWKVVETLSFYLERRRFIRNAQFFSETGEKMKQITVYMDI